MHGWEVWVLYVTSSGLLGDRPLSRQPLPGLPEGSLSYVLAVQELVIAVVAVGARQNSGHLG